MNNYIKQNYHSWRNLCLAKAWELKIQEVKDAGKEKWDQLTTHAMELQSFHWYPAGADWVNNKISKRRHGEIKKVVHDLLKDILKKARNQEKNCIKEATAALAKKGFNIKTYGVRQPKEPTGIFLSTWFQITLNIFQEAANIFS